MDSEQARAKAWVQAEAPIIWLLGKTQAGKTSIVAEITGQAYEEIGRGYRPMTRNSRLYAYPPEAPVLHFLDTRGLADRAGDSKAAEIVQAHQQAHLLLIVVRVDDLHIDEILTLAAETRRRQRQLPVLVAQTGLHRCYGPHDRHAEPYPFDGSDDDRRRPGVPTALTDPMIAQRRLFDRLRGPAPLFVPLDFTRPEQGIAPANYGAERLWELLDLALPEASDRLRPRPASLQNLRAKAVLPWSMAAATANAVPVPIAGGLASAGLQSAMVVHLAHQLGVAGDWKQLWGEFVSALGVGFLVGFGGNWTAQQVLKLGLGWGTAIVASWTFATTWAVGEAALYYFSRKSAGQDPDRAELRQRYKEALNDARGRYADLKRQQNQQQEDRSKIERGID